MQLYVGLDLRMSFTSPHSTLADLAPEARRSFRERYGTPPEFLVAAPGRVNLIGEHIDYCDGFVLPMAIDRYTLVAAARSTDDDIEVHAHDLGETERIDRNRRVARPGHWSSYVEGVVDGVIRSGLHVPPLRLQITSTVPVGGGLSSSAALEVATATLLEVVTGHTYAPAEKALLCQKAEHAFAGVPCGIMDQFSSVFGEADHLLLLDCRSQKVEPIPFSSNDISILIANSNVSHELASGEYAARRSDCESAVHQLGVSSLRDLPPADLAQVESQLAPREFRRVRHVVKEIERTQRTAEAVRQSDWARAGKLMYESHDSLQHDFEVSCHELDILVAQAKAAGVIGSRMTGGGFGGCTVSLVPTEDVPSVAKAIANSYREETGIEATMFVTRPSRGAHVIL
ncbi:MAG: galactokinase [Planctomycetota bacterium]